MSERILIVDDDPAERRLLDHMVHQLGYEPVVAASSDTVVAALADTYAARIDALLLDLTMSDFDAVGLLAKMRAAGLPNPIIVQTRDDAIDNLAAAMRAGATDFVVKPVDAERLRVSLRNALFTRAHSKLNSPASGWEPRHRRNRPKIRSSPAAALHRRWCRPLPPWHRPAGSSGCSMGTAICGRSRTSKPRPSDSLSRITTVRCPKSRGGCASGAPPFTASSIRSG
jgi:DNA-binding NtrC family response regulator